MEVYITNTDTDLILSLLKVPMIVLMHCCQRIYFPNLVCSLTATVTQLFSPHLISYSKILNGKGQLAHILFSLLHIGSTGSIQKTL